MNEDRKTNSEQDQDQDQGLPGLSAGSASGGPEALLKLVRGEPGTAGPAGSAAKPPASEPAGEEDALRDLLRGAVGGIEPSGDALERLRYAVPARRVRNRRILIAAAAAVVVLGGGVPVGLHLASGTGGSSDRSTMAGHGQKGGDSKDGSDLQQNGSKTRPKPKRSSKDKDKDKDKDAENGGASASPTPADDRFPSTGGTDVTPPRSPSAFPGTSGTVGGGVVPPPASSNVPICTRNQLGVQVSTRAQPAGGKVAGTFRVTNVSSRGCTVTGPETLTAVPASEGGAAVAVVSHVTGDPATGLLPDPSVETTRMLLAPNAAYDVRFAWVPPEGGCPGSDGSGDAGAPEGGSGDTPEAEAGTDTGEIQAETPPLGAVVSHTPSVSGTAGPTTQTTIAEACGGTVYRTGVIPAT